MNAKLAMGEEKFKAEIEMLTSRVKDSSLRMKEISDDAKKEIEEKKTELKKFQSKMEDL